MSYLRAGGLRHVRYLVRALEQDWPHPDLLRATDVSAPTYANLGVGKNCDGIPTVLQVRSRPRVSSLAVDIQEARAQSAKVSEEALTIDLDDGRTIVVPLGLVSSPLAWHASGTQSS